MPTYEVQLHDGRTIHIDADDQNAALAGASHFFNTTPTQNQGQSGKLMWDDLKPLRFDDLPKGGSPNSTQPNIFDQFDNDGRQPNIFDQFDDHKAPAQQSPTQDAPVTTVGLLKAAGSGALTGIAGAPGDFIRLGNAIRKVDPINFGFLTQQQVPVPNTLTKLEQAADNTYQPRNDVESALKTGAGIVAPAVITGPETLAGKGLLGAGRVLAGRAIKQAAIPTGAADAADWAAQGTPLEGFAGPLAALAAGGLAVRGKPASVSIDEAKAATNASYEAARNAGVTYDPNALAAAAAAKKSALNKVGISDRSAPSAHDTLDSFINNNAPMSLTDLEEHRQLASGDLSKGGKEGKAAGAVRDVIDGVMSNPQNAVSGANPAEAYAMLQRARTQALATQRLKDVDTMVNDATVTHNVHGTELNKAIKMQFGSALKNEDTMRGFADPDMAAQMHNISAGPFPQGIAKKLGGGDLSNWRVPELAALAFPPFAPAVVGMRALGYGLSKQVDAMALAKVARLKAQIAQQANLPFTPGTNPWPTRALISTLAAQPGNGQ